MRTVSSADKSLIADLAARDVAVSAPQLERWRRVGLLHPAIRRGLGRGRGSTSEYPPCTVDDVAELAALTGRGRASLGETALIMFGRGRWVREDALRAAYHVWLDSQEDWLGEPSDDPLADAESAAERAQDSRRDQTQVETMRKRLAIHPDGESIDDMLYSIGVCAAHVGLTGRESYERALEELLHATGVTDVAVDRSGLDADAALAPVLTALEAGLLRPIQTGALRSLVDALTVAELEHARDQARAMATAFPLPIPRSDADVAKGALVIAATQQRLSSDERQTLATELSKLQPERKPPPRPLARPGGTAHGKDTSACNSSVPPPKRAASQSPRAMA